MANRAELLAEAQRRGLVPSQQPSHDDLKAEAQKRGLIPNQQEQQQAPSKLDMIKKGFDVLKSGQGKEVIGNAVGELGTATQKAVEGNAEFKDAGSFESWQWSQPNLGLNMGNLKTTAAGMFGSDKDKFNSFVKQNPDVQIQMDKNQNPYFEDKGKKYYLDMPGLDIGDIGDFMGEAGLFAAGGNVAQIGNKANALRRATQMGLSQGGTDVLAQNLAGKEDIDYGQSAMTALAGGAFDLAGSGVNKARNARAGTNQLTGDKAKALEFAKQNNLNLGYDDLAENAAVRTASQQIDNIPIIGGGKFREQQNIAQKEIAEKFTKKFKLPDTEIDDLHGMVSGGVKKHMERSIDIAGKKYKKVYDKLDAMGGFDVGAVKKKAQDIIEEQLSKGSAADANIIKQMQSYIDIPEGNFSHWQGIRSDLSKIGREMTEKNTVKSAVKRVNKELNKSLDEVASSSNPQIQKEWRDANKFYENAVVRYKHGALKQAIDDDNPERILNVLMRKGGADPTDSTFTANKLFNGLDKKGKAAVRHGMMERAYKEALDGGDFSPARYSTMLDNYSKRLGVVLSKEDNKMADGLRAYMKITKNAGNFGRNTPTGQQAVPLLYTGAVLGGASLEPVSTTAGVLGIQAFKKLTRTHRGRSFMLAMSKYPKGKKPPPELLTQIARFLAVDQNRE